MAKPKAKNKPRKTKAEYAAELNDYIAERTDGGRLLIERLLKTSEQGASPAMSQTATLSLLERLAGRPSVEIEAKVEVTPTYNFEKMSLDEVRALEAVLGKLIDGDESDTSNQLSLPVVTVIEPKDDDSGDD